VQLLSRLILMMAVLVMPLTMSPAQANSAHHASTVDMPMGNCPDQNSQHDGKGGFAECTMACAASLPAVNGRDVGPLIIICDPVMPASVQRLSGLHPDTATPPPRRS